MGKSWLMVNMILQDIENGHGIFFLDPHGDAIGDLINRTTSDVLVFDPEDQNYSFGIKRVGKHDFSAGLRGLH